MPDRDPPLLQLALTVPPGENDRAGLRPGHGVLPAGLTLRSAQPEHDLQSIADVYNAAFGRSGADLIDAERVARIARHPGLSPEGVFLVFDGVLAVALGVGRLALRGQDRTERRGAIELLAVRPDYRGRGLAHALLHAILAWLATQGVCHVAATTDQSAGLHLLRQHGFAEHDPELATARSWPDEEPPRTGRQR